MGARLRLIEEISAGDPRPCLLLDALMGVHTRKKVGKDAHLARNRGGSFALIVQGQALVTFYEHTLELHLPPVPYLPGKMAPPSHSRSGESISVDFGSQNGGDDGWTPAQAWNRVLADRFGTVLARWGAEIVSGEEAGALYVLRAGHAVRLTEGLRLPYRGSLPANRGVPAAHGGSLAGVRTHTGAPSSL